MRHALVQPVGDLVQPPFEIAKQHVALFYRVALAAFDHAGQHIEALFQPLEDVVCVRHGRDAVDLVDNQRDLRAEALQGLLREIGPAGEIVDPPGQHVEALDDLAAWAILRHFLDLLGKRSDPFLDAFEGFGVE